MPISIWSKISTHMYCLTVRKINPIRILCSHHSRCQRIQMNPMIMWSKRLIRDSFSSKYSSHHQIYILSYRNSVFLYMFNISNESKPSDSHSHHIRNHISRINFWKFEDKFCYVFIICKL